MKVLITGGSGFLGKNLNFVLSKNKNTEVISLSSKNNADLKNLDLNQQV